MGGTQWYESVQAPEAQAGSKLLPVCFCFSRTAQDIIADLARHRRSTINESVKAAVALGLCACEPLNPIGKCYLPDIRRALRSTTGAAG